VQEPPVKEGNGVDAASRSNSRSLGFSQRQNEGERLGAFVNKLDYVRGLHISRLCYSHNPPSPPSRRNFRRPTTTKTQDKSPPNSPNPTRFEAVFGLGQSNHLQLRQQQQGDFTRRYGACAYVFTRINRVWIPLYPDFQLTDVKEKGHQAECVTAANVDAWVRAFENPPRWLVDRVRVTKLTPKKMC